MRKLFGSFGVAGFLAVASIFAGGASDARADTLSQCYFIVGIDAVNSCTRCSGTCLGEGYKCCMITVVEEQTQN